MRSQLANLSHETTRSSRVQAEPKRSEARQFALVSVSVSVSVSIRFQFQFQFGFSFGSFRARHSNARAGNIITQLFLSVFFYSFLFILHKQFDFMYNLYRPALRYPDSAHKSRRLAWLN